VLDRLKFFKFSDFERTIALVMPKHLLSLPAYARIFRRIEDFCRSEYSVEMEPENVRDFAVLLEPRTIEPLREGSEPALTSDYS
jgi:hypothetical protein